MQWDEEIHYEAGERDYLVQRRFYIDDRRWSWAVIGDERKMILTDNIGDVRVRLAKLGRKRILAEAVKGPRRTDGWIVTFAADSMREPFDAGRIDFAVAWMSTALYFDPLADEKTRDFYAPEAIAHRFGLPWPTGRTEYLTEEEYEAAQDAHMAAMREAADKMGALLLGDWKPSHGAESETP
jgi:hypothetical protein